MDSDTNEPGPTKSPQARTACPNLEASHGAHDAVDDGVGSNPRDTPSLVSIKLGRPHAQAQPDLFWGGCLALSPALSALPAAATPIAASTRVGGFTSVRLETSLSCTKGDRADLKTVVSSGTFRVTQNNSDPRSITRAHLHSTWTGRNTGDIYVQNGGPTRQWTGMANSQYILWADRDNGYDCNGRAPGDGGYSVDLTYDS